MPTYMLDHLLGLQPPTGWLPPHILNPACVIASGCPCDECRRSRRIVGSIERSASLVETR